MEMELKKILQQWDILGILSDIFIVGLQRLIKHIPGYLANF